MARVDGVPLGFGSDKKIPPKTIFRCKLGLECRRAYDHGDRCKIHEWTYYHSDSYWAIGIIAGFSIAIILMAVGIVNYETTVVEPRYIMIEGYNCDQLTEYIANKDSSWSYAEHRYKWLCVQDINMELGT